RHEGVVYDRPPHAPRFSLCRAPELPMSPMRFPVAVIFERTTLANRWVSERWEPVAVVPPVVATPSAGAPAPTPVKISDEPSGTRWRFDGQAFELHPTEAEGYYL